MNLESKMKKAVRETYSLKAIESDECYPYAFSLHCARGTIPETVALGYMREDLKQIPDEALMGLGCGNPLANASIYAGDVVLDLGCGGGIDVFLAAKEVGPKGKVIGIDMTYEMIEKARLTAAHYGYDNVEFLQGEIENLVIENESVDVIISNCVINLSPNKSMIFREAFQMLKPGGRLSIFDTAVEEKLPEQLQMNTEAWISHIGGAFTKFEYINALKDAGFMEVLIVSEQKFDAGNGFEKILSIGVTALKPIQT